MLISRAPLRISLAGGGTDMPAYYEQNGGLVVSTTIDKFVHVFVRPNGTDGTHITSADYQTFYQYHEGQPMNWDGELALPRAVLHEFGVERGLSIFVASEVPPGTGLGSSSAVAVALVQGIATYLHKEPMTRQRVAELACHVELNKLGAPIGKQDQFAAAFGGLNAIRFTRDGVTVEPLPVSESVLNSLAHRLLLFFTGTARNSTTILKEQQHASASGSTQTIEGLHRIKAAAHECLRCFERGDLDGIGALLDEGWQQKKRLAAGITNQRIDETYEVALANGAIGGKITGAGGGGFLLLYCHETHQKKLTDAMNDLGLRRMNLHLEKDGVSTAHVSWASEDSFAKTQPGIMIGRSEPEPVPIDR